MLVYVVLFSMVVSTTWAAYGVDVSQATSVAAFQCMQSNGYDYVIVRVYRQVGQVDANGAQTIQNAWDAGMSNVDGYIFPCLQCGNPEQQVIDTVNNLQQQGANFSRLWLDIEGNWGGDTFGNIQFIGGLINQTDGMGILWGIYTSSSQWSSITGNTAEFGAPPLWYAHYDSNPSFSDFAPFGGWQNPSMKQFEGDATVCGAGVDENFY